MIRCFAAMLVAAITLPAAAPEIVASPETIANAHGTFHVAEISPALLARMKSTTWRNGCPVPLSDIRELTVSYWDFNATPRTGVLLVNAAVSADALAIFRELFAHGFLIERIQPVEDYSGDDNLSMAANNTSAFNCRDVANRPGHFSNHSWGRAIDINPLTNPYLPDGPAGKLQPPEGERYRDRKRAWPGSILADSFIVNLFRKYGWEWGGTWRGADYQHFQKPDPARIN